MERQRNGSRLKFTNQQNGTNITVTVGKDCSGNFVLKNENANNSLYANWLFNTDIELIQDEIDIDSIEELEGIVEYSTERNTINQLIQAVKQLRKEVKELKKI